MYKNLVLVWIGICTVFACLLSPALGVVDAATLPAGFTESIVFSGLTQPTAIRFSPDGRVFVTEKSGLIKVFASLSATTPTVFHDLRTNVHNFWDRGLTGLELHPNFPTVPSVYVLYTYDKDPTNPQVPRWGTVGATSDGCPTPPGATTSGCVVSGRLSRLEVSVGSSVSTGTESVLIEGWGQQFPSHSMDTVMFGADGALYASAGEGASFTFTDYGQAGTPLNPLGDPPVGIGGVQTSPTAEGGRTRAQSLRRVSGPAVLNGTIIRVDPFTGAGLADNPLAASADPNARRIVGYGLRNPFRFTFRPGTNEVWVGDVGDNTWEEIDRIPNVLSATVSNFGWPCYEGAAPHAAYQALGLNICKNLYSSGSAIPPYFAYNHAQPVVAGETCSTGSSSITGIAFAEGGNYPAQYQGALFFGDISRDCIWSMFIGANGLPDPATRATFVTGAANPVDLQIGPGGDLFYVDFDGGTIRRIQFTSGNQAPNAVIQATPLSGPAPLTVTFDGRASSDPNAGDTLTYSWDLDGNGTFGDALTAQTSFTYTQAKLYTVQLKVTDNHGAANTASVLIQAGNPTAVIDTPAATLQWQVGQSIPFSGHATDPGQITLPPSTFLWEVILHHCPSNCHTHPVQSFPGVTTGSFPAPDHDYPSYLEIKLTVTDAGGLTDTKSVFLNPQTVDLNFASAPSGLNLVVGSSSSTTPFLKTVILGSVNSVSAVTPQLLGGINQYFTSWSDGGNQSHNITGNAAATYTATYSLTPDTTPPTMPTTLAANPVSGTQLTLSWPAATDNLGVTDYQVERCQGVGCTTFALLAITTATSYADTGLTPGTSYSYRVRAEDAVGNLSPYSPINMTTTPTGTIPAAVDSFDRADSPDLGSAWDPYTGFNALQIVGNSVRATISGDNIESYNAVPLPNDQWSQATLTGWNGTLYHNAHVSVRLSGDPATLTGYAGMVDSGNVAIIGKWTAGVFKVLKSVPYTVGVGNILRLEAQGTTLRLFVNNVLRVSTTDASYASGRPGLTIFITAGGTVDQVQLDNFSANSLTTADTTPPTIPTTLTASPISGGQITLSWPVSTDNVGGSGLGGYNIRRCTGASCTPTALLTTASSSATSFIDGGLADATTYGYAINSFDNTGNQSLYSSTVYATTPTTTFNEAPGSDTFTRGDTADLGATWDAGYIGTSPAKIVSQRALPTTLGTEAHESYNAVIPPNDQFCQVTIGAFTGAQYAEIGCDLRMANPPTQSWYTCNAARNTSYTSALADYDGTPALLVGENATTWVAGDKLRCEAQGTALRLYRIVGTTKTLLLSTTSAAHTSGKTGIYVFVNTGGNLANAQADDFVMGSLVPAVTGTIAFDSVSNSPVNTTANTVSWTASVGPAANRLGLVCVQARGTVQANVVVSSVNIGGLAATMIRSDERNTGTEFLRTEQWYAVNPGTGSDLITINWAGKPSSYGVGTFLGFSGVDPVAPIDAQGGGTGIGTTASAFVTTVADNAWIADCAMTKQNLGFTIGAGQTLRTNRIITGSLDAMAVSTVDGKTPAGTEIMDWTSLNDNFAISAVSLKPAVSP